MLAHWDQLVARQPGNADAWNNRGVALRELGRLDDAIASFSRALAINPGYAGALLNRGVVLGLDRNDHAAAIPDLERAAAINPSLPWVYWFLVRMRRHVCDWRHFEREIALLDADVRAGRAAVDPLFYHGISQSPEALRDCAAAHARANFPPQPALWRPRDHDRIRLGYLSGDLREHATAHLMAGLFEHHDRNRFEVWALDNSPPEDGAMRRRLEAAFDNIVPIRALSGAAAAKAIADAEIDILINVNGFAGHHRMDVSAYRPAPLQVNYLGFPGSFGVDYIDYIVADRIVIPEDEQGAYNEKVVWLPDCYQANDDKRAIAAGAPSRAACGLSEDGFVFCNFNSNHKFTPPFFETWMRILGAVEGSVLWLLEGNAAFRDNIRRYAQACGVAPGRLVFAPSLPPEQNLARLALADLALDMLPLNAHTSGSDALWAGLPLLTLRGTTFPGRVAESLLHAVGLPELVAPSLADYEALAIALANDPVRLRALRERLAANRVSAPLFDTARFTRQLDAAYAGMWEIFQRGESPRSFAVTP